MEKPGLRYSRLIGPDGEFRLVVEAPDGVLSDLTSVDEDLSDLRDLFHAAWLTQTNVDDLTMQLLQSSEPETHDVDSIVEWSRQGEGEFVLDRPFDPPEVWAAGVTYESSEMERRRESATPDVYAKVYTAERPELFFKATSDRCVGPFESVGIRSDSKWSVPEPELAFVLYKEEIAGYTIGNDMSSRSIEGENPLYLPQAKVYDRSCSIGPAIATADTIGDPHNLEVSAYINRNGKEVFRGETSTALMARKCQDLADWLQRHNAVPDLTAVLTGTSIVPPPDFTLKEGDIVSITIEGIGTLENDVVEV